MRVAIYANKKLLVLILLFGSCMLSAQWQEYTKEVKSGLKTGGNGIKVLCEDQTGNIWISSERGDILKYNNEEFTRYDSERISILAQTVIGEVVTIGSGGSGAYWHAVPYKTKDWVWFASNKTTMLWNGEEVLIMTGFLDDEQRMILSSGNDQKNYVLKENELVLYEAEKTIKPKKRVNNIFSLYLDNDEKLWLGSDGGLFCLDKGIWKTYDNVIAMVEEHEDVKGSEPTVSYIFKDAGGNTWFNFSNCIVRYDDQKFYMEKAVKWPGPPFQDSQGNTWIGYQEGVFKYKDGEWTQFEQSDGMEDVYEPARIGEDRDGNIWFLSRLKLPSAKGGKIYKYNGSQWESFTVDKKGSIFDLYIDSNGDPWCACINGAFKYQEKEWVEMKSLNFTTNYHSIFEDSKGNLWFGADSFTGRLDKYTPE